MDENKESLDVSDLGAHLPALDTGLSAEVKAGLVSALKNKTQSLAGQYSDVMENSNPKVKKRKRVELLREIQGKTMDENKESLDVSDLGAHLPALDTGLSAEVKAGLVSTLKNKTQSLAGQYSDVLENSNPRARKRKRVELLREIQSQHDELKAKFFKERAALEAKYLKLYESLFTKRYEIVNGVVEVESVAKDNAEETKTDDKGLPGFWLTAMKNNDVLTEKIQKRDEKALKFLKDIKWSRIDDPKGFKLEFFFNSNPYFKNSVLTKTYHIINNDKPPIGTEIEWYSGKCLTWKILKRTNARPIPEIKGCDSFFSFFSPLPAPEDDKYIARVLQQQIDEDYDIGCTIRDEIIPHAVSWFTGEAAQDNNFQDLVEDDDGEDNDEDEEEDDDDEEEDSKPKCLTGIYYMYAADMSSLEHHPSYQQIPRPPTWGPSGGSQMQQTKQIALQSSNQQTQQIATGTGYDYYGQ